MIADQIAIRLSIDTAELERDLGLIESGKLERPTVSAVHVSCEGVFDEEFPIWLPER